MSGREARRNDERLHFKFLTKYFEGLHADLFEKAEALFNEAKKKNPGVKDLTKTSEFMAAVTPGLPVPRYYQKRQIKNAKPTTTTTREMVLQVQLLDAQDLRQQSSPPVPLPPIFQQSEQDLHASTAPVCLPDIDCEPLPLLTESTYNELLVEIQNDPDLVKILNDFPSFTDDCEVMNECVWNSINNDTNNDITPLQMEINNY